MRGKPADVGLIPRRTVKGEKRLSDHTCAVACTHKEGEEGRGKEEREGERREEMREGGRETKAFVAVLGPLYFYCIYLSLSIRHSPKYAFTG